MRSGQRVGKYVLGERIGRGGMAEVWAARAEGPGGFVKSLALKFISETFAGDADLERLFVNEARVAAQLQHANLVTVFDFDKCVDPEAADGGRYFIAMERVDGHDLRRVMQVARHQSRRLPPEVALHIAGEVLKALRYVHERPDETGVRPLGLVHRDVSPHNVLVGMGGEVKLSDFGIAKAMSQSLGTQAGTIRGKLAYASPEQLRGEGVDHRADQFALGITLWEMLAERRLFEGADEMEIVGKILRCQIPPLPATTAVGPPVEILVRRMLASAPRDRFPTTAEALAAVLAAPGYVPHAPTLADLMRALFAPRVVALPPTVPVKLSDPHAPGGLAQTSELDAERDGTPSGSPPAGAGTSGAPRSGTRASRPESGTRAPGTQSEGQDPGPSSGAQALHPPASGSPPSQPSANVRRRAPDPEGTGQVREPGATTGSGYVSADTPPVPSWIESSDILPPPKVRRRLTVTIALAAGLTVTFLLVARTRRPGTSEPDPTPGSSPAAAFAAPAVLGATAPVAAPPVAGHAPEPSAQAPPPRVATAPVPAAINSTAAPATTASPPPQQPTDKHVRRHPLDPATRQHLRRQPAEPHAPAPPPPLSGPPATKKSDVANGAPILE